MNIAEGLITIDFNALDIEQRWSSIHLPHVVSPKEQKSVQSHKLRVCLT